MRIHRTAPAEGTEAVNLLEVYSPDYSVPWCSGKWGVYASRARSFHTTIYLYRVPIYSRTRVDRKVVNGKTIHVNYSDYDSERGVATMKYSSELIQTMRDALEAVMATVPADQSVFGLKAAVAQCILQAAAHGQTSFDGLVASASGQLQTIISMLS